jgi:hypothetical protein
MIIGYGLTIVGKYIDQVLVDKYAQCQIFTLFEFKSGIEISPLHFYKQHNFLHSNKIIIQKSM